jgi:hypothetical protein
MVTAIPTITGAPVVQRTWVLSFAVIMQSISFIFVAIRLVLCIHPTHAGGQVGIDDLFIVIAWVLSAAATIMIVLRMGLEPNFHFHELCYLNKGQRSNVNLLLFSSLS